MSKATKKTWGYLQGYLDYVYGEVQEEHLAIIAEMHREIEFLNEVLEVKNGIIKYWEHERCAVKHEK